MTMKWLLCKINVSLLLPSYSVLLLLILESLAGPGSMIALLFMLSLPFYIWDSEVIKEKQTFLSQNDHIYFCYLKRNKKN